MRPLAALLIVAAAARVAGQSPTVTTTSGPVTGVTVNGIAMFKGIPYAAPPVDSLRWQPPRPPTPWTAPLTTTELGASCMQPLPIRGVPTGSRAATTSEDCLTLNIWAPAAHAGRLPVMVWIYGGGNVDGTAGRTLYDGTHFADDGVILVSFNYRLGLLGFFVDSEIAREAGRMPTGNFALLDQLSAIRWVHRNIAAFGGDPDNVTVVGESAGGQDLLALLAANALGGAVRRAIIESPGGGWSGATPLADALVSGDKIASQLARGLRPTLAQLRKVPAETLLKDEANGEVGPIVDGKLVKEESVDAFADDHAARISIMIGTNSDEGSLIAGTQDIASIFPRLEAAASVDSLRALYGTAGGDRNRLAQLLFRDGYFAGPVRWIADHQASRAPTWLYRFDYVVVPFRATRPGASHGSEIPFIFENWPIPLAIPADRAMEGAMHSCWIAFAVRGIPDCAGLSGWSQHTPGDGRLMVIDDRPSMRADPVKAILDLIQQRFRE